MEKRLLYFLRVAQTLNVSQAAKELYITQQGLSFQIKALESEYGVKLFERKPRLNLTPAGESLLNSVCKIAEIEGEACEKLREIAIENKGVLKVGITSSRSTHVLPEVIQAYSRLQPDISVHVIDGVASRFEEMLEQGQIDCFIAVGATPKPYFRQEVLFSEKCRLAISNKLLREYFSNEYPGCVERFARGIDLRCFQNVPIIIPAPNSRVFAPLKAYLNQNDLVLNSLVTSNNYWLRFRLASLGVGAAVVFSSFMNAIRSMNPPEDSDSHVRVFPITNVGMTNYVSIVSRQEPYEPQYLKDFIGTALDVYHNYRY